MPADKKKRAYSLYSLVRLLLEEAALAAVVLWLLPRFGVSIPLWVLILFMAAWAVYSFFVSRLVGRITGKAPVVGTEALVGAKCITTTPLLPNGYVRVGAELWRARSTGAEIKSGIEVVIVGVNRLTLSVNPLTNTSQSADDRHQLHSE